MLLATGMTEAHMERPLVGIASVWFEGNPCNMHLSDLAAHVKQGVQEAGLVGLRFNAIGVSDGISMGTEGMSYSLQSRFYCGPYHTRGPGGRADCLDTGRGQDHYRCYPEPD
jgi:dihydroxyacid dehydratase/phosphogluconate dehydratase